MAIDGDHGTQFFLMRHAATVWNREGRIQGQADAPLARSGRRQIETWRGHVDQLQLDEIHSSDLGRALATARGLNLGRDLPLATEPRLREQDWGRWTGRVHRHLKKEDAEAYARQTARGWQFQPPAGESHLQVLERALAALRDMAAGQTGRRILVVTHEGVLKCLVYHLAIRDGCGQPPGTMASYHLHHLVYLENRLILRCMNAVNLNP
jgi:probable phosphoglycerate mutase